MGKDLGGRKKELPAKVFIVGLLKGRLTEVGKFRPKTGRKKGGFSTAPKRRGLRKLTKSPE